MTRMEIIMMVCEYIGHPYQKMVTLHEFLIWVHIFEKGKIMHYFTKLKVTILDVFRMWNHT
jgi:hypothetical protein